MTGRRVQYFGQWADEAYERQAVREAYESLCAMVRTCAWQRPAPGELQQPLKALAGHMTRPALLARLERALSLPEPAQRCAASAAALEAIRRCLGARLPREG